MRTPALSLRSIFGLIVGFMGVLALAQAWVSGEVHRSHAYANQRQAMERLIHLKAEDLLADLAHRAGDLAASLQSGTAFQQAFQARDTMALARIMDDQFHDYYVTTGMLKLKELAVYGPEFAPVARRRDTRAPDTGDACVPLLQRARARSGPDRMKLLSGLCEHARQPYFAVIHPIGGLRLKGYVVVVTDPVHNLAEMERMLGMPVAIRTVAGATLYRSQGWSADPASAGTIAAQHVLDGIDGRPLVSVAAVENVQALMGYLPRVRFMVMAAGAAVTLAAVGLVLWVLRRTTLQPLRVLTDRLQQIGTNRALLGQPLHVGGSSEIRALARSFNDMNDELGELYGTLETMAFTDPLTGLPNRNRLQERLYAQLRPSREGSSPFAVLLMDIDRFKFVNETLGHSVGDLLLKAVATRLQGALRGETPAGPGVAGREADLIVRLGGDEFAVLLPTVADSAAATGVARRLGQAMETPFAVGGHQLRVGASIGIVLHPQHGTSVNDLMRRADVAMYKAKQTRAGHVVYDAGFDANSLRRLTLERDLREAIGGGQLVLHYQPKIDLRSGRVCGTEALVRWRHPELGTVPPDEFIPLAEQTGQIRALTAWVLDRAVQDCTGFRKRGHDIGVAVNLSAVNLHDGDLCEEVKQVLARWQFDPAALVLELTESAVMADPERTIEVLEQLRAHGVGLSIDDFGTGHSSLAYVKRLPVTEIKVDRSFVRDVASDTGDAAIIRAVVELARHRALDVVAEGVEDAQTYARLQSLGCGTAQGYFIACPMPAESCVDWLDASDRRMPSCSTA